MPRWMNILPSKVIQQCDWGLKLPSRPWFAWLRDLNMTNDIPNGLKSIEFNQFKRSVNNHTHTHTQTHTHKIFSLFYTCGSSGETWYLIKSSWPTCTPHRLIDKASKYLQLALRDYHPKLAIAIGCRFSIWHHLSSWVG